MRDPKRLWMSVTLLLLFSACSPAPAVPATPPAPTQSTPTQVTPAATDEALNTAVPAIIYPNWPPKLVVVSSATGNVFKSFAPIPLGRDYAYSFSPDAHQLAVAFEGQLDLVELPAWKLRQTESGLHGWLSEMVYSPDGALIAMASGAPKSDLRVVDAKSGEVKASGSVDFSVRNMRFTTDEKSIMVYGPSVDGNGIMTGAPSAALMAVEDLSTRWSVKLESVRDGATPKDPHTTDIHQPGAAWYYSPGIAFAPLGDILYVIHGDSDLLTSIDFDAGRVKTISIHTEQSWLDRLMTLGTGVAHAKGMDGTTKQAVVSPDGRYLYVISTTVTNTKLSSGEWDLKTQHGGLEVIATADGSIMQSMPSEAELLSLSPDGDHLFLSGWKDAGSYSSGWSDVYEIGSEQAVKQVSTMQLLQTHYLDGRRALASINYLSENLCRLASVDITSFQVSSDWKGTCLEWLVDR